MNQNRLKELYRYDSESGLFTILNIDTKNQMNIGDIAGTLAANGYVVIKIDGNPYKAHRLAWLYVYGNMPTLDIDHINHVRSDNRIENLREANSLLNSQNKSKYKNNTSGVVGVKWQKKDKRWIALITVNKKKIYLGCFVQFHEAVNARKNAEILYGFHTNHGKDLT